MRIRYCYSIVIFLLFVTQVVAEPVERRRDQFGTDFSYFIYPIAADIPGLGVASGFGGSVLNIAGTDTDFTGFNIDGDFSASGYTLLDIPIKPRRVIFDFGTYDFDVAPVQYFRGINSSVDQYFQPHAQGDYDVGQLTLTFDERRYEFYTRYFTGRSRLLSLIDSNGSSYPVQDDVYYDAEFNTLGFTVDLTDDRLDPRRGARLEVARNSSAEKNLLRSEYYVMDYNLSGYIPMRQWDTLVLNLFASDAHVTRYGPTDFATLQQQNGLNCDGLPAAEQQQCLETEAFFINETLAANQNGTASSLGGTQRLRSFANGRFYAGHSRFIAAEYRWNLTDEKTPFDIYIAKGIRTGLQLAFFYEMGTVNDDTSELWSNTRSSYGTGFRMVLSGVVIRADWANGDEGSNFQLFINYPFSMFSVDNPG